MSEHTLRRLIAVVASCLLGVIVAGSLLGSRSVADDLRDRSGTALAAAGLDEVRVDFRGREGELRGGNDVESRLAMSLVGALPGVRSVDARRREVTIVPGASRLELDRAGDEVQISGVVSSPDDAAAIKVTVATTLQTTITGDVAVDQQAAPASWVDALADVLTIVGRVEGLDLRFPGDGTVGLGGRVDDQENRSRIARRVAAALPDLDLVDPLEVTATRKRG